MLRVDLFEETVARSGADPGAPAAALDRRMVWRGAVLIGMTAHGLDVKFRHTRELGIRVELDIEVRGLDARADGLTVRGPQRGAERRFEAGRFTALAAFPSSTTSISPPPVSSGSSVASA